MFLDRYYVRVSRRGSTEALDPDRFLLLSSHLFRFLTEGGCSLIRCSKYAVCNNAPDGTPTCVCPKKEDCPADVKPVCGTDDNTYINECLMRVIACRKRLKTSIKKQGLCGREKKKKFFFRKLAAL